MPPVIQLAADIDPEILQLQIQAQGNVAQMLAAPSTSESTPSSQVPAKQVILNRKGKRDAEVYTSARTSGALKGDGSNESYPSYLFQPVPKQLKEDLRRQLLVEQIKYTKKCNTLLDKAFTMIGPVKYFLSNMPKLSASSHGNTDHTYQFCDDTDENESQEINI